MTRWPRAAATKFAVFAIVTALLTAFLFMVFGQIRTGPTKSYSAIFADVSDLHPGETVRVAGARVGTVSDVRLGTDNRVTVTFNVDDTVHLTTGTRATVRYLNLTGDRFLELADGPGSTRLLPAGAVIPSDRTAPALDLDLLLGGLKPVIQGLNAAEVNALTSSVLQIMQGQQATVDSLLSKTSSFGSTLADNSEVVQQMITNLDDVLATLSKDGDQFSATVDRLQRFVSELSEHRDSIGEAIQALDRGTASLADLLTQARPPLSGTLQQLARLAPNVDQEKDRLQTALQKLPDNSRKLVRTGTYGNFTQLYMCALTVRLNDPSGKVLVLPWLRSDAARCKGD